MLFADGRAGGGIGGAAAVRIGAGGRGGGAAAVSTGAGTPGAGWFIAGADMRSPPWTCLTQASLPSIWWQSRPKARATSRAWDSLASHLIMSAGVVLGREASVQTPSQYLTTDAARSMRHRSGRSSSGPYWTGSFCASWYLARASRY